MQFQEIRKQQLTAIEINGSNQNSVWRMTINGEYRETNFRFTRLLFINIQSITHKCNRVIGKHCTRDKSRKEIN